MNLITHQTERGLNKELMYFSKKNFNPQRIITASLSHRQKERGFITIPFLLISLILLFLILSFLFLNMTLVHISITQYMSYSSARRLFLSNKSELRQVNSTIDHYSKLRSQLFSPQVYRGDSGDWFFIPENIDKRNNVGTNAVNFYPEKNTYRNRFYGVNLLFKTFVLKLKIPMLIASEDKPLSARVSSFLGREPSQKECEEFHKQKYEEIKKLCSETDCPGIKPPDFEDPDNGC